MKELKNSLYRVVVNRESVCMADDMDDHSILIELQKSCTIKNLIQILERHNFFGSVSNFV